MPETDVADLVEALRQEVMGGLAAHFDPRLTDWVETAPHLPRFDALAVHMEALEAFYQNRMETAATLGLQAFALDTTFLPPLLTVRTALGNSSKRDSLISVFGGRTYV